MLQQITTAADVKRTCALLANQDDFKSLDAALNAERVKRLEPEYAVVSAVAVFASRFE